MMERKINGKSADWVFRALQEDIPGALKSKDENDQPYLDGNVLLQFFESYIPPKNYDFLTDGIKLEIMEGTGCFVCNGTIVVKDDDGNVIVRKSSVGSYNIAQKKDGSLVDMAMAAKNAAGAAQKNCIRLFGCGTRQLNEAKKAAKDAAAKKKNGYRPANNSAAAETADGIHIPKTGKGTFLLRGSGKISTYPKMILIPVECLDFSNYKTQLLIWKDSCRDVEGVVNDISSGRQFLCSGKFESYNNAYRIVYDRMEGAY
jgi:hypothetical protein